jgi:hypothetical protein
MTIVLTNCTSRKKGVANPTLNQDNLVPGSIESVANQWLALLGNAPAINLAHDIYCGRGFREAEATSRTLNCPLYVVSAGLGVIKSDLSVPVYNLTVTSEKNDSVLNKVCGDSSPRMWWSRISKMNPFGSSLNQILTDHDDDLILIALPRTYLELVKDDLLQCPLNQQLRLRFFGKNLDTILPSFLTENWMPYDDRLDGAGPGFSGTQSDFAQRALRHFVLKILSQCEYGDANTHRVMALDSLSSIVRKEIPKRQRLTDTEIGTAIRENWARGKGQSSLLLRIIRQDLNIACEQSRFRDIYHSIRKSIGDAR